jgi:uncharacterized membrane protein
MMYWGSHMSAGNWIFSILGTVVLLALVVGTIVWLLSNRSGGPEAAVGSAGEILDRRLAGGEITSEQDDELRERLDAEPRDQRPPSPAGTPG